MSNKQEELEVLTQSRDCNITEAMGSGAETFCSGAGYCSVRGFLHQGNSRQTSELADFERVAGEAWAEPGVPPPSQHIQRQPLGSRSNQAHSEQGGQTGHGTLVPRVRCSWLCSSALRKGEQGGR